MTLVKRKPRTIPELRYHSINCKCAGYNYDWRCAELTRSVEDAIDRLLN